MPINVRILILTFRNSQIVFACGMLPVALSAILKKFRQFCIEKHAFNAPTKHGNMSYKTNAEIVCGFLRGEYITEPHTALEDARDFELPILLNIIRHKRWQDKIMTYNWRNVQVRDNFKAV